MNNKKKNKIECIRRRQQQHWILLPRTLCGFISEMKIIHFVMTFSGFIIKTETEADGERITTFNCPEKSV